MQVPVNDFIKTPSIYLDKLDIESIFIIKDNQTIAVLTKPDNTPLEDSLVGLFKDAGIEIENFDDIKAMRTGI